MQLYIVKIFLFVFLTSFVGAKLYVDEVHDPLSDLRSDTFSDPYCTPATFVRGVPLSARLIGAFGHTLVFIDDYNTSSMGAIGILDVGDDMIVGTKDDKAYVYAYTSHPNVRVAWLDFNGRILAWREEARKGTEVLIKYLDIGSDERYNTSDDARVRVVANGSRFFLGPWVTYDSSLIAWSKHLSGVYCDTNISIGKNGSCTIGKEQYLPRPTNRALFSKVVGYKTASGPAFILQDALNSRITYFDYTNGYQELFNRSVLDDVAGPLFVFTLNSEVHFSLGNTRVKIPVSNHMPSFSATLSPTISKKNNYLVTYTAADPVLGLGLYVGYGGMAEGIRVPGFAGKAIVNYVFSDATRGLNVVYFEDNRGLLRVSQCYSV